jgi:hypothetical protein
MPVLTIQHRMLVLPQAARSRVTPLEMGSAEPSPKALRRVWGDVIEKKLEVEKAG